MKCKDCNRNVSGRWQICLDAQLCSACMKNKIKETEIAYEQYKRLLKEDAETVVI